MPARVVAGARQGESGAGMLSAHITLEKTTRESVKAAKFGGISEFLLYCGPMDPGNVLTAILFAMLGETDW